MILESGADYFNPDEATHRILTANPGISLANANSAAWYEGKRLLERAIDERLDYTFENTPGGKTTTALLERAIAQKMEVRMWYVGLRSPELNVERVHARVAKGGHDITEAKIHERYRESLLNLIRLLPNLTELLVYDNTVEGDPQTGKAPEPELLLHLERAKIVDSCAT